MLSKVAAVLVMNSTGSMAARTADLQRLWQWFQKKLRVPRGRIYGQPINILLNLHK